MAIIIKTELSTGTTIPRLNNLLNKAESLHKRLKQVNQELVKMAKLASQANQALSQMGGNIRIQTSSGSGRGAGNSGTGGAGGSSGRQTQQKVDKTPEEKFAEYLSRRQEREGFAERYKQMFPKPPKPTKPEPTQEELYERYAQRREQSAAFKQRYEESQSQPSLMDKITKAVMTSRISANGGLMPLVGKLAAIAGPEIALVAAALKPVLDIVSSLVEEGAKFERQTELAYATGGGTAGQSSVVTATSMAMGFNTQQLGRGLSQGYGPMIAGELGLNPIGGPFGDMDYNRKSIKILEAIAKAGEKNFTEARRIAEALGQPEAAQFALLSKATQSKLLSQMEDEGPQGRGAIELESQKAIMARNLKPGADLLLAWEADLLNTLNYLWKGFGDMDLSGDESRDEQIQAQKENTQALHNMTKYMKEGIHGGAERAMGGQAAFRMQYSNPYQGFTPYGIL